MKNILRRYRNRYFLTITISSFFPLAILSLLILVVSFSVYDYEIRKRSVSSFEEKLDSYTNQTDLKYRRIKYIANQLAASYNITSWMYSNDSETDLYQLWQVQKDLNSAITSSNGIFSIDLFNKRDRKIISTYSGLWYGDTRERLPGSINPALIAPSDSSSRVSIYGINDNANDRQILALSLIYSVPLNGRLGTLSINIPLGSFINYDLYPEEQLFLTDPDNTFLYASAPLTLPNGATEDSILFSVPDGKNPGETNKADINGKHYLISYRNVFDGNYKLVLMIPDYPSGYLYKDFIRYFTGVFILILLISFAFSMLIYRTARKPLRQIIENIRTLMAGSAGEVHSQDEINYLNTSINSLINRSNEAEKTLQSYKGAFIENTLRDLLFGRKLDQPSVFYNVLEHFNESNAGFMVLTFNMDKTPESFDEALIYKFYTGLFDEMKRRYKGYYLRTGFRNYTFVACLGAQDTPSEYLEYLKYIQDSCLAQYGVELSIGVSTVKKSYEELDTAYNEALDALKCKITLGNRQIILYGKGSGSDKLKTNYFPIEEGQLIINKLRTAGEKETFDTLSKIIDIKAETYSIELLHAFLLYIASCIAKVATEYNIRLDDISGNNMFDMINNFETVEEKKMFLQNQCGKIIEARNNEQKQLKKMSIEMVVQYIDKRYDQPLSLSNIAEDLHISASYLSNLIKKELGVSFLIYLNNLRMAKAIELLRSKHLTVKEIASMVGYDSEHSFIRNFKKVYGRTPSEYRNQTYRKASTLMND